MPRASTSASLKHATSCEEHSYASVQPVDGSLGQVGPRTILAKPQTPTMFGLDFMHSNFAREQQSLAIKSPGRSGIRCKPAMGAGVTNCRSFTPPTRPHPIAVRLAVHAAHTAGGVGWSGQIWQVWVWSAPMNEALPVSTASRTAYCGLDARTGPLGDHSLEG